MVFTSKKSAALLLLSSASLFATDEATLNRAAAVIASLEENLKVQSFITAHESDKNSELMGKMQRIHDQLASSAVTLLNEKTALAKGQETKERDLQRLCDEYTAKIQELEVTKKYHEHELMKKKKEVGKELEDERAEKAALLEQGRKEFVAMNEKHNMAYEQLRETSAEFYEQKKTLEKINNGHLQTIAELLKQKALVEAENKELRAQALQASSSSKGWLSGWLGGSSNKQ